MYVSVICTVRPRFTDPLMGRTCSEQVLPFGTEKRQSIVARSIETCTANCSAERCAISAIWESKSSLRKRSWRTWKSLCGQERRFFESMERNVPLQQFPIKQHAENFYIWIKIPRENRFHV